MCGRSEISPLSDTTGLRRAAPISFVSASFCPRDGIPIELALSTLSIWLIIMERDVLYELRAAITGLGGHLGAE